MIMNIFKDGNTEDLEWTNESTIYQVMKNRI